jgi:hypothetical protein
LKEPEDDRKKKSARRKHGGQRLQTESISVLAMDELDELKGRVGGGGAMIGSNRVLLTSNDVDLLRLSNAQTGFRK